MEGKLLLYQRESMHIRDENGVQISFQSLADFEKYHSGKLDLSKEYYIDYEPERKVYFVRKDPTDFSPLENKYTGPIPEYEAVIADAVNMKDKFEDPYFGMDLNQAREHKLESIKMATYREIIRYMPEWRQIRWNEYVRLHEKKEAGEELTRTETFSYNAVLKNNETHETCYQRVNAGLEWILDCVEANDEREKDLKKARSLKAVKNIAPPDYPPFPVS